jgi:dihydroorotate dehydrogenase electron transfer subunit
LFDHHAEIAFNIKINPVTFLMGLVSPQIASAAKPGQFVMVRVNEGLDPLLRRPFSICGVQDQEILLILYKIVGRGTEMLAGKRPAEKLSVMGPLGHGFSLPDPDNQAILVAGGIGLAPLYFLACTLKDNLLEFMTGFGSSGDIIPGRYITHDDLNVSVATDDGSSGYSGFVTGLLDESLERHSQENSRLLIYACGPMPMLKKTASIASDRNIPCQVSLEALMACGLGACQGCAIKVLRQDQPTPYCHVCKDGPVFMASYVDWSGL